MLCFFGNLSGRAWSSFILLHDFGDVMSTAFYPAIIETDNSGGYSVFFPDLPGCTSAGETVEEAVEGAIEAANLYIEVTLERGPLPHPSSLQAAIVDADVRVAARLLVPVTLPGKTVRTNFDL